ncbi:MAG: V-type ATP synthase subunit I [Nitrososphaerales archaeon]
MTVATLSKVTVFVPRSEFPILAGYIAEIEEFHTIPVESETYDKRLSLLASTAYRISSELSFLIENLGLNLEQPIIKKAFGGLKYETSTIEASNWNEYIAVLEQRTNPIISTLGGLIRDRRALEKKRDDFIVFRSSISALSSYHIDLAALESVKRFHVEFLIVESTDIQELRRSIPEAAVIEVPFTERESAILVIGNATDDEKISKALRSFDPRTVTIPKDLPQTPDLAYKEMAKKIADIEFQIDENKKKSNQAIKSNPESILGLHEAANVAYSVLDELKKSGKLKRVSVVSGYVPTKRVPKLEERIAGRWPLLKYEVDPAESYAEGIHESETGATVVDQPPTLFDAQNPVVRAHQAVTLTSGPPVYGEFDPTPILTLTFPIFYGIMFGDLGHGLLMVAVGALIYLRGTADLKKWGLLLLLSGISASIFGLIAGEFFGFELPHYLELAQYVGLEPLKAAISPSNPDGLAFNSATVFFFIKLAIYIGIVQLYIGLFVGLYNRVRTRDYWHILASTLPTIVGYTFFVILAFAFKDLHFSVSALFSLSSFQGDIGLFGLIGAIVWLFVAGPVLAKTGKIHGTIGSELGIAGMEFLEWVVSKFVANTVSYVRLAILLVVHAALLAATNLLWFTYHSYAVVPALVILNLLIFAFEGLIVYVQALRLHLYEFFSKFYVGTGTEFRKITPDLRHLKIKWREEEAKTSNP